MDEPIERHMHEWVTRPPVDHDPIKLDESGEVVVLIKTTDGDLYLRSNGENSR